MKLAKQDRILFFGDSITDVGRDRTDFFDLGKGFPLLVNAALQAAKPEYELESLNRGISGDQIQDLIERFDVDCVQLDPDAIVLLIGINDVWHHVEDADFLDPKQTKRFEAEYRTLLTKLQQVTKTILILEPFVLHEPSDRANWRASLDPKIQIVRQLAKEFSCEFIALDGYFTQLVLTSKAKYYTGEDGVHPTPAGHHVIATKILETVEWV
ncbi:SGNH/GDSL hydrolase family protein [Enterococcus bulliens]